MKNIRIGHSGLSGKVYAGKILKDGQTWAGGKVDVTNDFLAAVLSKFGGLVSTITSSDGEIYELTCKRVKVKGEKV